MINFNSVYTNVSKRLIEFRFFDNFSYTKRMGLIEDFHKIMHFICNNEVTQDQQIELKKLRVEIIKKSSGNFISNFFLKTFYQLPDCQVLLQELEENTDKLSELGLESGLNLSQILINLGKSKNAKKLESLLIKNHLYEHMKYFKHPLSFNEKGEMTFKFTKKEFLKDAVSASFIHWERLHRKWSTQDVKLEERGNFENGCYKTHLVKNMTCEELKELLIQDGKVNENIQIVYPTKYLTLQELEKADVVQINNQDKVQINSPVRYVDEGFVEIPENWQFLTPTTHIANPPKDFTVEVVVHQKGTLPSASIMAHASIKLTTPNGEVYSLGFHPTENWFQGQLNLKLQKGNLITPDPYIFFSTDKYSTYHLSYTLPNAESFHKVMQQIVAMKGYDETEEREDSLLFYHPLHQNCADFAYNIRNCALQNGAKAKYWEQHKLANWTGIKIKTKIMEFFLNILAVTPLGKLLKIDQGVEYADITNFNVKHLGAKGIYLPLDLIFEHLLIHNQNDQ
jgi:hypothetical protein